MTIDRYRCPGCHSTSVARVVDDGGGDGEDYRCRDCDSPLVGLFDLHRGEVVRP